MPNLSCLAILLLAALFLSGSGKLQAEAVIYRCVDDNGIPVFSDQSCSSLGVHEPDALPDGPPPLSRPSLVDGCSRQVDMLETGVRTALESGDVNHLAGLYHWADATVHTADTVLPGLQELTRRPLIDIEIESVYFEGDEQPVRLWLYQRDPDRLGRTIRTGFSLVSKAGCWWLQSYSEAR